MPSTPQQNSAQNLPSDVAAAPGASGSSILITLLMLTVAVWGIYARADRAPFIFDDRMTIEDNRSIRTLWPLVGDAEHPGPLNPPRDISTAGRPLVNLTFAVNYALGGLDPWGYHVTNITLHVLNALLVWAIVRRTLQLDRFQQRFAIVAGQLAFGAALLWAVHPLLSETIEYVTQRTELLVALFYLSTLYASLRYWTSETLSGRKLWLVVAAAACACGMASKEVMATTPIVVLVYERTFVARSVRDALARSWPLYAALASTWATLIALNISGPRAASAGFHVGVPMVGWWLTQSSVLLLYLRLAVWPSPLVIHYDFPIADNFGDVRASALLVALLMVAVLTLLWRRTAAGFVGAWILLILAPTLLVPIVTEVAAERRMYLPLAALVALFVVGGYALVARLFSAGANRASANDRRPLLITFGCLLVLLLAAAQGSARRVAVFNDAVALWQDAAVHQPQNARVHNNLGAALVEAESPEEAIPHYERALELKPDYTEAQSNLGVALVKLNRPQEARAAFAQALVLDPDYADAHINLGHLLAQAGEPAAAVDHYRRAIERKPHVARVHANLAQALVATGQSEEGIKEFHEALRLDPDLAEAHLNLGAALAKLGRLDEARSEYEQAIRSQPDLVEAHSNLGAVLNSLGQQEAALAVLEEALRLRPEYAEAHSNLGIVLFGLGRSDEALAEFKEAARLQPTATAVANLAMAYAQLGRNSEALAAAEEALRTARQQRNEEVANKLQAWLDEYRAALRGR